MRGIIRGVLAFVFLGILAGAVEASVGPIELVIMVAIGVATGIGLRRLARGSGRIVARVRSTTT